MLGSIIPSYKQVAMNRSHYISLLKRSCAVPFSKIMLLKWSGIKSTFCKEHTLCYVANNWPHGHTVQLLPSVYLTSSSEDLCCGLLTLLASLDCQSEPPGKRGREEWYRLALHGYVYEL